MEYFVLRVEPYYHQNVTQRLRLSSAWIWSQAKSSLFKIPINFCSTEKLNDSHWLQKQALDVSNFIERMSVADKRKRSILYFVAE